MRRTILPIGLAGAPRRIEIDDMEAGGPRRVERLSLLEGVAVFGLVREPAPEQAYAPSRSDIDGRPEVQGQVPEDGSSQILAKRSSTVRPAEADFSGWNWVPNRFPSSKATASSPP